MTFSGGENGNIWIADVVAGQIIGSVNLNGAAEQRAGQRRRPSLYVANARGRGAGPNPVGESQSPKFSVLGTVNIIPTPARRQLDAYTTRVYANNGFAQGRSDDDDRDADFARRKDPGNPIPSEAGRPSAQIKHVVLINKENATHDLLLGDITQTRRGVPVNGQPAFSLGIEASPNHHELALRFAFSDNFFLEPSSLQTAIAG